MHVTDALAGRRLSEVEIESGVDNLSDFFPGDWDTRSGWANQTLYTPYNHGL